MRYVLARECLHEDHQGEECVTYSYLQTSEEDQLKNEIKAYMEDDDGNVVEGRSVKIFESKAEAQEFMKEMRYSPDVVMILPYEEGIYE
jgi:hypothetical protein